MQRIKKDIRKPQEDQTDLLEMLRSRYTPYWPLFLLAIGVAVAVAFVYLRYATPMYRISSTLLIKDDQNSGIAASMSETLDIFGSGKEIDNEIEVLKSRTLARTVIQHLRLYGEIVEDGKIRDVVLYKNGPVNPVFLQPELIKPTISLNVPLKYDAAGKRVILQGRAYPLKDTVMTPWGKMVFLPGNQTDTGSRDEHHQSRRQRHR